MLIIKNNKGRLLKGIAAFVMLAVLLTGCSGDKLSDDAAAMVNGTEIPMEEYDKNLALFSYGYSSDVLNRDDGSGLTLLDTIKDYVTDKLVLEVLIYEEAEKNDIKVTDEDIEEAFNGFKEQMANDEILSNYMEENGITDEFIKDFLKKSQLVAKYEVFYTENLEISDDEAKAFYEENPDLFTTEEVHAKHIVVSDQMLADELYLRTKNGEDFQQLAKEYSEDPTVEENGGDLGYFPRGVMVKEFEDAAFSLQAGEISEPVESQFGYHIIKVEDKLSQTITLEDAKNEIINHLVSVEYNKHIEELMEKAKIIKR
ncbi:peptidylprolyl isomerase [Alkaliphilus pronyensis]|nr:peptidylprolyl isomerase [Alkaliphilus pronyensis]